MHVAFPYGHDLDGRTASTDHAAYVRDLIEQVLFTTPGERVNRPDFGSGILQLVFAPNSEALASVTQATIQGALLQWLGQLIELRDVAVENVEETLKVTVSYVLRTTGQATEASFTRAL